MEDGGRPPDETEATGVPFPEGSQISADWWCAWQSGEGCPDGNKNCTPCAVAYAYALAKEEIACLGQHGGSRPSTRIRRL